MGGNQSTNEDEAPDPVVHAQGELFVYNEASGLTAFEFGESSSSRVLVCIAGLTDGLLSMRYLPRLARNVGPEGWRVIQPLLQSSYSGWGIGSLDEDASDIDCLLKCLVTERGVKEVVLLGHSTGCQDVVTFLEKHPNKRIKGAILQAPVSDREALQLTNTGSKATMEADLQNFRKVAATMISQGRGEEVMPRAACQLIGPPHVITAYRFNSLTGRMTDDDMFSSDLTDGELSKRFHHVKVPTLVAISLDDEYVPKSVDVRAFAERMQSATKAQMTTCFIEKGGHGLKVPEGLTVFINAVKAFLGNIPEGEDDD